MQAAQFILNSVPTPLLAILFVIFSALISSAGLMIVRRAVPTHRLKLHNDVAGFIFTTLGVVYAVLLAFMVVVAWQSFDRSITNTSGEARSIATAFDLSSAFGESTGNSIRDGLRVYTYSAINDEWPLLSTGSGSSKTEKAFKDLYSAVIAIEPGNEKEKIFLTELLKNLDEAGGYRHQRLMDSASVIHPVLWSVLLIGAAATISFMFFFGTENFMAQLIMTCLLSGTISLVLFTILVLDLPFSGSSGIGTDSLGSVLAYINTP